MGRRHQGTVQASRAVSCCGLGRPGASPWPLATDRNPRGHLLWPASLTFFPSLLRSLRGCEGSRPHQWRQEDTRELGRPCRGGRLRAAANCYLRGIVPFQQQDRSLNLKASLLSFFRLPQAARQEEEARMPNGDKHKVPVRDTKVDRVLRGWGSRCFLPKQHLEMCFPRGLVVPDKYYQFH